MRIYRYSRKTREYVGSSEARESPLEPGVYLVPANATATAPPDAQEGYARVWDGASWAQVEDHRGETVYSIATGEVVPITAPGPLPDGVTALVPGPCPIWDAEAAAWTTDTDALAAAVRAERDSRIEAVVWRVERYHRQVRLGLTPTEDISDLDAYIQALCDVPEQPGFPWTGLDDPNCPWPEEPAA